MADNNTPKLPLSDFALKSEAAKQDRILMTDSLKAHSDAAIEVQDFCSSVIRPQGIRSIILTSFPFSSSS